MSQTPNPYAQFGQPSYGPGYGGDFVDPSPRRTSITAIIALVISIVGCIAFCVPAPGAVAMVIGGLAVFFIARSEGRLSGMGLAVAGIVLGVLQSIVCAFFWFGIVFPATGGAQTHYIEPFDRVMMGIEKGDTTAARGLFTPAANKAITDEMLADFAKRYQAEVGEYKAPPTGTWDMIVKFTSLGQSMQAVQQNQRRRSQQQNLLPMPATFAKKDAIVLMHADMMAIDQTNTPQTKEFKFPIVNIGVLTSDGKLVWLMDEKKALEIMISTPDDTSGADPATTAPKSDGTTDKPPTP